MPGGMYGTFCLPADRQVLESDLESNAFSQINERY